MSLIRVWRVLRKDLKMGPRSPIVLYAVFFPIIVTLLVNVVFGRLFNPVPRLGVVDEGSSEITGEAKKLKGIDVTILDSPAKLKTMVEGNDLDVGLILQPGFDNSVRRGEQPDLNIFISGESLASNRIILGVTAFDMIRAVAGAPAPIDVDVTTIGGESVSLNSRLLPFLVLFAMLIAGVFVPAASMVEEKEKRTLEALLVTPTQMADIIVSKGILGFILAMLTGLGTLALNQAFGANPGALVVVLALGAFMAVEFGLILGSWAKDTNTLFTAIKGGNFFLMIPVFFFIWPGLPQWIPKIFPTYYFLFPLYEIAIKDASLASVGFELMIGVLICIVLLPVVFSFSRRLETRLVTG